VSIFSGEYQSAEKALKAVLIKFNIPFQKTHSIRMLIDLIPDNINVPKEVDDASILTDYAVTARYPVENELVDQKEYFEAVLLAEAVYNWASNIIKGDD
jgi:HEPN domain-containing protein